MHKKDENKPNDTKEPASKKPGARKPYAAPEILLELELETRAGSPLGVINPLDLDGDGIIDK